MHACERQRRGLIARADVRWMVRRDMPRVLSIDTDAGVDPFWMEEDFLSCMRQRNCIGMVAATKADFVRGYMIYEIHRNSLSILRFAVEPEWQGLKIGAAMIEKLRFKLATQVRLHTIVCAVPEENLPMQLFLRSQGFGADRIESRNDGEFYVMRYSTPL